MEIYNACGHELKFYNASDVAMTREGNYVLSNQSAEVVKRIRQMQPLNAQKNFNAININEEISFFREMSYPAEILQNFWNYDVIVVSRFYAVQACKSLGNNPDFLDRLFVPNPLWTADLKKYPDAKKCGCAGITKFLVAKTPQAYVEDLRMGGRPSVVSVKYCLQTYNNIGDANTLFCVRELQQRLPYLERREENV